MLEFPTIQQRGFRNVKKGNRTTGFQIAVRSKYYRGVWASQLRPATVSIDGVKYSGDAVTWTIAGKKIKNGDLAKHEDVHWTNTEAAILTVEKPGGLAPGIHDVDVSFQYSASYLPPRIDLRTLGNAPRRIVLVR